MLVSDKNAEIYLRISDDMLNQIDLMILSPGIAVDHPFVMAVKRRNIPVWGEIELAYRFSKGKDYSGNRNQRQDNNHIPDRRNHEGLVQGSVCGCGNIGNPYST